MYLIKVTCLQANSQILYVIGPNDINGNTDIKRMNFFYKQVQVQGSEKALRTILHHLAQSYLYAEGIHRNLKLSYPHVSAKDCPKKTSVDIIVQNIIADEIEIWHSWSYLSKYTQQKEKRTTTTFEDHLNIYRNSCVIHCVIKMGSKSIFTFM